MQPTFRDQYNFDYKQNNSNYQHKIKEMERKKSKSNKGSKISKVNSSKQNQDQTNQQALQQQNSQQNQLQNQNQNQNKDEQNSYNPLYSQDSPIQDKNFDNNTQNQNNQQQEQEQEQQVYEQQQEQNIDEDDPRNNMDEEQYREYRRNEIQKMQNELAELEHFKQEYSSVYAEGPNNYFFIKAKKDLSVLLKKNQGKRQQFQENKQKQLDLKNQILEMQNEEKQLDDQIRILQEENDKLSEQYKIQNSVHRQKTLNYEQQTKQLAELQSKIADFLFVQSKGKAEKNQHETLAFELHQILDSIKKTKF